MPDLVRYLVDRAVALQPPDRQEAIAVLRISDPETLSLVAEVGRVRRHFFQDRMTLNFLLNIKSGLCPEDCHYCSQSNLSTAAIPRYSMLPPAPAVEAATIAVGAGAKRFCMVASGTGPSKSELRRFIAAVRAVKSAHLDLEICACFGLLSDGQGEQLKEAGVFAYNHNLNTSQDHYGKICSTHDFADREQTVWTGPRRCRHGAPHDLRSLLHRRRRAGGVANARPSDTYSCVGQIGPHAASVTRRPRWLDPNTR